MRFGNAPKNRRLRAEAVSQLGVRSIALICLLVACDAGVKPEPPPKKVEIKLPEPPKLVEPNLAYLPADADLVIKLDVATLRKSKLWPTYVADVAKQLLSGTTACADYQPLADDVTSVMIGVTINPERSVLVFRGIDRAKMQRCLHEPKDATFDDGFTTVKNKTTVDVATFVDKTTMVVARAKEATRPALQANTVQDTALIAALRKLPPKMRAVLVLRYFEDLSEPDIAGTLGCSVGTVKSQASRGLDRLRAQLASVDASPTATLLRSPR